MDPQKSDRFNRDKASETLALPANCNNSQSSIKWFDVDIYNSKLC